MNPQHTLTNEHELLTQCAAIEGLSFSQLASKLQLLIPHDPVKRKGWVGLAVERALGASAGNEALPDFPKLGIELKTLPLNHLGKPAESTFITSISLLTIGKEQWPTSQCFSKLRRILWLPIEGDKRIPFADRRIGKAVLWSPSNAQETILADDWKELSWLISSGKVAEINAKIGQYLQVRPKAANSKSLCLGYDESGNQVLTLPRGFYLRSLFTAQILSSETAQSCPQALT